MYSIDFRRRVLAIKEAEGLSFAEISSRFKVGIASVVRWSKKIEPQYTRNKPATKIDMEALKKDVALYPDAYHYERAERLKVSTRCVGYALKRLGVSYKKNSKTPQSGPRKTLCFLRNS